MTAETRAALVSVARYVGRHAERESRFLSPDPAVHVEVYGLLDHIREVGLEESEIDDAVVAGQKDAGK